MRDTVVTGSDGNDLGVPVERTTGGARGVVGERMGDASVDVVLTTPLEWTVLVVRKAGGRYIDVDKPCSGAGRMLIRLKGTTERALGPRKSAIWRVSEGNADKRGR